jgi:hypothetical protein
MLGPLEYIVIGFAGNRFDGSIARELDNKDDPRFAPFTAVLGDRMALLTPEDLEHVASELPADTSGMVMLFEHRWAEHVKEAMAAAGGLIVRRSVIPPEVLEALSGELEGHVAAVTARNA